MNLGMKAIWNRSMLRAGGMALVGAALAAGQSTVNVTGGRLMVAAPNGDQSVKVEVRGTGARLFGFPGVADGSLYSGLSGVEETMGTGNDAVEVDVEGGQSFDVKVDTGSGPATTTVKWKILPGILSPAAVMVNGTGLGERKVDVVVESEVNSAVVGIDTGSATEVKTVVKSSNDSAFLRVSSAGTARKSQFELEAKAQVLEMDLRATGTNLDDEMVYILKQGRPATVAVDWALDGLAGNDKLEATLDAPGSTVTQRGTALGRGGDDDVKFTTAAFGTATGLVLNGGAGNDKREQVIQGRYLASQTLQTRLLGADGNDILLLTTDTGIFGTGLTGDLFPVINCGPGVDQFNAFGQILGCESRL
ncbi:MAG: hypothetical protein NW208_00425 [Bryobacter sp.]|nr:hypothetical protein [Bryobacter sp.]